tara:strand:+ start:2237 stop:3013 length:777 start_codon:yes stop_codon:yes gene_type:complete
MQILIGDIGNTFTKLSLIDKESFIIKKNIFFKSKYIQSRKLLSKSMKKIINKKSINKTSLFSSVVPKYFSSLKKYMMKNYRVKVKEIKDTEIKKLIKISIRNKKQVGSDRIANAVGAYKKYKTNCIILDFGTATTFDVVYKEGIYNGGVIAPGINLSLESLNKYADQLPVFKIKKQRKIIGKNTVEALRSGFYWGYSGLINNIILKIKRETKKKYKIILTGGYANLFKSSITKPHTIDKDITIKGIIEILKNNKKIFI